MRTNAGRRAAMMPRARYAAVGVVAFAVGVGVLRRRETWRVDVAAVVDKYVGETERRLDALLGRAEDPDVVLLSDEGDDLFDSLTDERDDGGSRRRARADSHG